MGLIGSDITGSLDPPMHEREADLLGPHYLYRAIDLSLSVSRLRRWANSSSRQATSASARSTSRMQPNNWAWGARECVALAARVQVRTRCAHDRTGRWPRDQPPARWRGARVNSEMRKPASRNRFGIWSIEIPHSKADRRCPIVMPMAVNTVELAAFEIE